MYDFLVGKNVIIELDGEQHFKQVSNWTSPEHNAKNDLEKTKFALIQGYSVIRLLQDDVWNEKYDWKSWLVETIEKLKSQTKLICQGVKEYDQLKSKIDNKFLL